MKITVEPIYESGWLKYSVKLNDKEVFERYGEFFGLWELQQLAEALGSEFEIKESKYD